MLINAERTGRHEFTAWIDEDDYFQVIVKNAYTSKQMFRQIKRFVRNTNEIIYFVHLIDSTNENNHKEIKNKLGKI